MRGSYNKWRPRCGERGRSLFPSPFPRHVSRCLVPFSRAPIICIDRTLFRAKTRLNSAATGPRLSNSRRCPPAVGPELSARRIEGCKRQATDLLARDFYSLSLPMRPLASSYSPPPFPRDGNGRFSSEDAENFFATVLPRESWQCERYKDHSWAGSLRNERRAALERYIFLFFRSMCFEAAREVCNLLPKVL